MKQSWSHFITTEQITFSPMNKLLIILLFLPFFADAQIGMLLRPLEEEETGGGGDGSLYPGDIADLVSWIVADSTASVTYSGGEVTSITDLVSGGTFSLQPGQSYTNPQHDGEAIVIPPSGFVVVQQVTGTKPSVSGNFIIAGVAHNVNQQSRTNATITGLSNASSSVGIDYSNYDVYVGTDYLTFPTVRSQKEAFVIDFTGSTLSDVDVYVNNSLLSPSNSPTTSIPSMSPSTAYNFTVSVFNTGTFKIYELLIIDASLSASDREALFQYFYNKHSITP
jgi:hypothetical protein